MLALAAAKPEHKPGKLIGETVAGPVKLVGEKISSPHADVERPPPLDYEKIIARNHHEDPLPPLVIQAIATLSVLLLLALAGLIARWMIRSRQLKLLEDLPEACSDGTWLVVAYEWDNQKISSGRMPLEGIGSISQLLTAAVEYGCEFVSDQVRDDNIDVKYMDEQVTHPAIPPRPAPSRTTPFHLARHSVPTPPHPAPPEGCRAAGRSQDPILRCEARSSAAGAAATRLPGEAGEREFDRACGAWPAAEGHAAPRGR